MERLKRRLRLKNSWSIIRWFWAVSKHFRLQSTLNAIIGILVVGLDFSFIWTTKLCIDIATGRDERSLHWASILLIIIMLCQISISFSRRWIGALLGVKARNRMQQTIFRRLLMSEWHGREMRHSGDVLNRLVRDVHDVTNVITDTVPASLSVITRFVGAFIFLYSMDSRLACLLIVIVPAFAFISRLYIRKMRKITREIRDTDSIIHSLLQESIQHRIILKTLERIDTTVERLEKTQAHLRQQVRHRTVFSSISGTLLSTGFATGYLITFLWGANRLHEGTITYGMMLAFIQLVGQIQGPFRDMTKFVPIIISAFTAGERLMELEEVPTEQEGSPILFPQGAGLRLSDVTYAYDNHERHILQHFSYDFPPGSSTAILGETGAGKTTLIRLILALLRPNEGKVEMYSTVQSSKFKVQSEDAQPDSVTGFAASHREELAKPLNSELCTVNFELEVSPLTRCNLVYVPQDNTLFSGSIRDNLLLGNPDATEQEMQQALQTACADFVLSLPDGIDSTIGENATGLSQGQAQRICIARALLRNGNILLLDESTSALDTETEARLLRNLHQWKRPWQTLLFVTHRHAVVNYCGQVLHLDKLPATPSTQEREHRILTLKKESRLDCVRK
ncbi:MAG: ABC transporter ATP-binding protein [Bacteroidaceae bacterium]|nr:ABC transporter ATP-binding protein [Bacteroidaceae bacterium]